MKTRISVVIPFHNVQEFMEDSINSVLDQTINEMELGDYDRNLQIILVDDGSTDKSAQIAKQFVEQYDNIEYVYEDNNGPGYARNYGCKFAEGDYIVFCDSDDLVPPKAYERMYNTAIRNNSDMVIGNVLRFNSKGYYLSTIHEIAFSKTIETTHITETPELIYDTTCWNKLFKRDLWEKNNIQFPEGILYEDIPLTLYLHYYAESISFVYDYCYLWRIREGISKSITQTTDESQTLKDRLTAMGLVDDFFKKNISTPKLKQMKDIKWLRTDLNIFLDKLKSLTEEEAEDIINILAGYIKENIDFENFKYLNEFNQLKYKYLLDDDYEKLMGVINFEFFELEQSKLNKDGSSLAIDVDDDIFDTKSLCVDKYINEYKKKVRFIKKVSLKKKHILVEGFTIVPGLEANSFDDVDYSFYLVNSDTNKKIELEYKQIKTGDLSSFNVPYYSYINYDSTGYRVYVPYSKIKDDENFYGENRILITFKQGDVEYNYFAGYTKIDVRRGSDLKARIEHDHYFMVKYNYRNEIVIDVEPVKYSFDNVFVENDNLCLDSPEYLGEIYLHYEADSLNDEKNIPINYNEETNNYEIPIKDISYDTGVLYHEDKTHILYPKKDFIPLNSSYGPIVINALRDYYYKLTKLDDLTAVSGVTRNGHNFLIESELFIDDDMDKQLKSVNMVVRNKKNYNRFILAKGEISNENNNLVKFNLNLSDEEVTKNLFNGVHDIFAVYDFGDSIILNPLYLLNRLDETYSEELYDYRVYRSNESKLRIRATQKWGKRDDTPAKRKKHSQLLYDLFRLLPIKKNRIMFEAWWGQKYHCNPRYFYEYIDENHPEYECVWGVNDIHTPINGNAIRTRRYSWKYYYYLATSKYFINNVNFPNSYKKRKGQVEIQTMHGTPLKTIALDTPGEIKTKKAEEEYLKRCDRWNFLTVQSDFVAGITKTAYRYQKKILNCGYPRTDILFTKDNEKDINKLKEKMGIPLDKKVILYAPTWRVKNKFDLMLDLNSFKKALSDEYVLILRLHPFALPGWKQPKKDSFVYDLSVYDSVEELYLISDILITDYSSVMFDYAILDRPIILFAYDLEEYRDKLRGMYIDIEENKPGPILFTSKEVEDAIVNLKETETLYKKYRDKFRDKFNQYECENSSEKLFDIVIKK